MARTQSWLRWALALLAITSTLSGQTQRIPRQTRPITGSIVGVLQTETGLGVSGARVVLVQPNGRRIEITTTGDGVFLRPDLPPGTYHLTATRDGFALLEQQIQVRSDSVTALELTMIATPGGVTGLRDVPRASGGPPLPPLPEDTRPSFYRDFLKPLEPGGAFADLLLVPPPEETPIFTVVPSRWKYKFPPYRRYPGKGEFQYTDDHWYDPFDRNKVKGDYPLFGNRTFLNLTVTSDTLADGRMLPLAIGSSTANPTTPNFFGHFGQFAISENLGFSATLSSGDTSFRPIDWQLRFTPAINFNYLATQENGIVNINVLKGTDRYDNHAGLQEGFFEARLKDLSNEYDFVSLRAGIQTFNSDFRGFIFFDQEPGLRLFGNLGSNRYQYNLAAFTMLEKDTNSGLNSFGYRHQQVYIANLYRQDFFIPGYTTQFSFHYDKDDPSVEYDQNNFLVRPAPIGVVKPHAIRAYYYGWTGDGHIGRINVNHAFYQVLGHDTFNPIAGKPVDINARMAALELSIDKDWLRYRASAFYASGDKSIRGNTAHGFDSIFDNPNFAGGIFSFWDREGIRLTGTGVGLSEGDGLLPSLRTSKIEGQANFVNPGIFIYNAGIDADVLPKLRAFFNLNFVRFDHTAPLEALLLQSNIHTGVGADQGVGIKYRPLLSDNISITSGFDAFVPFQGFRDIYTGRVLFSLFTRVRFQY